MELPRRHQTTRSIRPRRRDRLPERRRAAITGAGEGSRRPGRLMLSAVAAVVMVFPVPVLVALYARAD